MKLHRITNLILLAFFFAFAVGCQPEDLSRMKDDAAPGIQHNPTPLDAQGVILQNDRLVFTGKEHYIQVIEYLDAIGDERLAEWSELLGHRSIMREYTDMQARQGVDVKGAIDEPIDDIADEILATLLNSNNLVQIGQYAFHADVLGSTVRVFDGSMTNSQILESLNRGSGELATFSTEDDVLELLEEADGNLADAVALAARGKTSCSGKYKEKVVNPWKMKIVYQRAGIYYSLIAKIKKGLFGGWTIGVCMIGNYTPRSRSKRNVSRCTSTTFWWRASVRPYRSTRRLVQFDLDANYSWSQGGSNTQVHTLSINCH